MDNENAQIIVAATAAVASLEVMLYVKNLITAYRMEEAPPGYEELKGEKFEALKSETIIRCEYEIAGAVMNCVVLAAKIWYGYHPIIWEAVSMKIGKSSFFSYFLFEFLDVILNRGMFAPIWMQIRKCRGEPGLPLRTLAEGHADTMMPIGLVGLALMIFAVDADPWIWFTIPFVAKFDAIFIGAANIYKCRRLIESNPESAITKRLRDVAMFHKFPVKSIYKDYKEGEVAEANYYELEQAVIVSEKLLSLPEVLAVTLVSQEIGLYTRRRCIMNYVFPLVRMAGLGLIMVKSFANDDITEVFGFDEAPYPFVPVYLAYAHIWPVFSNILYRFQYLYHSRSVLKADVVIHMSTSSHGVASLKVVAGLAEKYPIFDSWYSQLIRGYPTVDQRIKNLERIN